MAAGTLVAFCAWAFGGDGYTHLRAVWFWADPIGTLPLLAVVAAALGSGVDRSPAVRVGLHVLAAGVIGVVALAHVFDETWRYARHFHFHAMFAPVVQVHLGKVLLVP